MYSSEVVLSMVSCSVNSCTEVTGQTEAEVHGLYVFPQITSLARLLSTPTTLPQRWPTPHRELFHLSVDLHVCRMVFNKMRKSFRLMLKCQIPFETQNKPGFKAMIYFNYNTIDSDGKQVLADLCTSRARLLLRIFPQVVQL